MLRVILLPVLAVVGGVGGFFLRRWELATAFEAETGLAIPGAPATVALIVLSVVVAALVWTGDEREAGVARIYVDSRLVAELPLDVDCEYVVREGDNENTIEISGGRARMSSANCADEYCVRQGYISYDGETVICLPHRVVIELEAAQESGLDAIAS